MELVATGIGLLTLVALAATYVMFARSLPFGALSLPCMTLLTSLTYFFLMPSMALSGGNVEFLGMYLASLEWVHFSVLLYALGGAAAWVVWLRHLRVDPTAARACERPMNPVMLCILPALAVAGIAALVALGSLQFVDVGQSQFTDGAAGLAFLNLSISMLLPLTLVLLIRTNFRIRGLLVLAAVSLVILTTGFRFRIVILASAVALSYLQIRRIRIRIPHIALGMFVALVVLNAIALARTYGRGVDLSQLDGMTWLDLLRSFGGEIGPVYALANVVESPPHDLIYFDPWLIAVARFVPTFLWPDKPYPTYLLNYSSGFGAIYQDGAGVAAPQHAEILLQFGWFGLPVLAFFYFAFACKVVGCLQWLGREARIAGCALAPSFFGFYMQQRGYFFQILCEFLFMFGPLFLIHFRTKLPSSGARGRPSSGARGRPSPFQGRHMPGPLPDHPVPSARQQATTR